MGRLLAGAVVVALVSWVWSGLFYVVSPVPYWTISSPNDDIAAGAALLEHFPETGSYILPGRDSGKEIRSRMRAEGPVATVYIDRDGSAASSPRKIILGTIHGVVIGFLIGLGMRWLTRRGWSL